MVEALINGKIIDWAIIRDRQTRKGLANKLRIKPEKLQAWITGEAHPSFNRAEELANKLKIPFGYLYLESPPNEQFPLPDLRTIYKDKKKTTPSPDFLDVIYDAMRKQDWYREQLKFEDRPELDFIGRCSRQDEPDAIASDVRDTLGINVYQRPRTSSWEAFLKYLIAKVEDKGVVVLRNGFVGSNNFRKLDVNEFLGFVISDNLAPLVFINANDYKTAQIFTLIHEVAHLWINQSGVLNPNYRLLHQKNEIETFCDSIAAEVLVPHEDFELRWDDSKSVDENISDLAVKYRVSAFVVLRRAYSLDMIGHDVFNMKYDDLLRKVTPRKVEDDGHFYSLVIGRNSRIFTRTLVSAVASGLTSPVEAAKLLNVKIGSLNNIENYILSQRN